MNSNKFQDTLDQFCNCRFDIEIIAHFFLHFHNLMYQHQTLLDSISQIDYDILKLNENLVIDTFLFGNPKYSVWLTLKCQ